MMNRAAESRIMPIRTPNGDIRGYTVRGHHNLPTGFFLTAELAYEEALMVELNRHMGANTRVDKVSLASVGWMT
jgi:hypothetical protein